MIEKKRHYMLIIFLLFISAIVAGCNEKLEDISNESEDEDQDISIASAGTGGTFYILASGISDLINSNLNLASTAEVTGGSNENIKLIEQEETELAVSQLDLAQHAVAGEREFDDSIELDALIPMYPNLIQIVTLEDSDIESFSDLEGKTVSVGEPGSGVLDTNEVIFENLDLSIEKDINPEFLSFEETKDAFKNGNIDAAIFNTAAPAPFITDLEATDKVKFISFSDEEIETITSKFDYYDKEVIPQEAYKALDEDVDTFAIWIGLFAEPDVSEDTAYDIVKTILENKDSLKNVHVNAEYITEDNIKKIKGVNFHEGAKKYFDEEEIAYPEEE